MIIKQRGTIDAALRPTGTKACPWCRHVEGLVATYCMAPKPEQVAFVFIQCGDTEVRGPGCGARGPWRMNPVVLKDPESISEVGDYFLNMGQVAWSDWNKQRVE